MVIIFLIELSSLIFFKLKISKNFEHSNLTFVITEIDNNFMNLKKNFSYKSNVNVFTDENRLRVKEDGLIKPKIDKSTLILISFR